MLVVWFLDTLAQCALVLVYAWSLLWCSWFCNVNVMRQTRRHLGILIFSCSILIRQRQKLETTELFSEAGEGWTRMRQSFASPFLHCQE